MTPTRTPIVGPMLAAAFATVTFVLLAIDRGVGIPVIQATTAGIFRVLLILGAGTIVLGAVNLFVVHVRRVQHGEDEWTHSLVLVGVATIVVAAGLVDPAGHRSPFLRWTFDHILWPGQSMLFALTTFFLAAAGFRYMRVGQRGGGWLVSGALIMLLTQTPWSNALLPPELRAVTNWILSAPVMAAMRGALLGSALALLVTGVRYLFGRT